MFPPNKTTATILISWILFWIIAPFVPKPYLFDILNALGLVVGGSVLYAYFPGIWASLKSPHNWERANYLILGIFATWIAMVGRTAWLWWWRWQGEPAGGLDNLFMAFVAWLIVSGGVMHLLAPRVLADNVPKSGWNQVYWTLIAGLVFGIAVATLRYVSDSDDSTVRCLGCLPEWAKPYPPTRP